MSIYFSISVWKFSFSVSINGVVNNKKKLTKKGKQILKRGGNGNKAHLI